MSTATISSFYQWVTSERADFFVARSSLSGMVVGVLLSISRESNRTESQSGSQHTKKR